MALLPAGALLGKALMDKLSRKSNQIARTSTLVASSSTLHSNWKPRPRMKKVNPFARAEIINRIGGTGLRNLSTKSKTTGPEEIADWVPVYRYPNIQLCRLLARAKFVQTLASVTYLPYSTYQYSMGAIDSTWFYSTAVLAIAAPLILAVFSRYINRLVGVIAMSEDNEWVRIGYLTYWGSRKNKYLQLEDVLPISELGSGSQDRLVRLTWYSGTSDCLFLPTNGCEILDEERAELLFGNTNVFYKEKKFF